MSDELDRVRISAAELRAEASNLVNIGDFHKGEIKLTIRNRFTKDTLILVKEVTESSLLDSEVYSS